jgi:uncharacterized protein (UPF0128 family)
MINASTQKRGEVALLLLFFEEKYNNQSIVAQVLNFGLTLLCRHMYGKNTVPMTWSIITGAARCVITQVHTILKQS